MSEQPLLDISALRKIDARPGDVFVLELPADHVPLTGDEAARLSVQIESRLGSGVKVLVLPPGAKLQKTKVLCCVCYEPATSRAFSPNGTAAPICDKHAQSMSVFPGWKRQAGLSQVLEEEAIPPLNLDIKASGIPVCLPKDSLPHPNACINAFADHLQDQFTRQFVAGGDSEVASSAEPSACPEGHHLKDGSCRYDFCHCGCSRCRRECEEGGR